MSDDFYADPVGHCIKALASCDDDVRFNAADILRGLGKEAAPALLALCHHMLADTDSEVRCQCAFALSELCEQLGAQADAAEPYLQAAQRSDNDEIREFALHALKYISSL
uniref:HEAT repeat domain-containing protein n=1 Tax=Thaumasiovibrio occultus TaxID=1891184 RepID=UPI000B3550B1|nr:HEAT repeat domain-containing protein [Thaumasiovibrio occultus]